MMRYELQTDVHYSIDIEDFFNVHIHKHAKYVSINKTKNK